jgi:ParB/RepB/Spo0J family partition protein
MKKTIKEEEPKGESNKLLMLVCPSMLREHPQNRRFEESGERWEQMVESVRRHGVITPPTIRMVKEGDAGAYQILAGHRRKAAAVAAGLDRVLCVLHDMDDRQAAEFVLLENLQREDLDAYEEARGVRGLMDDCGKTAEEVAEAISRSVRWVKSRQLLLDLPEEVVTAVRKPRGDAGHLSMGAVEEILRVPEEWRAEAVQLVLHPDLEAGVLNEEQSREVLRRCLLEPKRREAEWEANREAMVKAWRGVLQGHLHGEEDGLLVIAAAWGERERIAREGEGALERVRLAEQSTEAPEGLLWLHLAVRHGMAVRLVPDDSAEMSRPVVDAALLRQAESARADGGEPAWLVTKRRSVLREEGVERALGVLDGNGEVDFDEEERPVDALTQTMERHAWCNLTGVHAFLAQARLIFAAEGEDGVLNADPSVPAWAEEQFAFLGIEACEWVLSLAASAQAEGGAK